MNYRLNLSYDGTKYKGWQRQKSKAVTIQGKVEETISKYLEQDIKIIGASRTDSGVHAKMQVCNFRTDKELDVQTLKVDLNHYLPKDIVVNSAEIVDDRFHSRFNAVKKTYTYTIWRSDAAYPPLFNRKYVYQYDKAVDIDKMKRAGAKFVGKHDFRGFCSDKTKKSTMRCIEKIQVHNDDYKIKIHITGNGFLHNMIRIIVGTMLEIGTGDMKVEEIDEVFAANNRELAGFTSPAKGLFLEKIYYEG